MIRADIISTIGRDFLISNIENDEYSYPKSYKLANLDFTPICDKKGRKFPIDSLSIRLEFHIPATIRGVFLAALTFSVLRFLFIPSYQPVRQPGNKLRIGRFSDAAVG